MTKNSDEKEVSFEEALTLLEQIVRQLEEGQLGLSESLARYEEGVRCLKRCHQALEAAERRVVLLTAVDNEGVASTEPFDEEAMSLDEKKQARTRRRSQRSSGLEEPVRDDMDTPRGLF